MRQNRIKWTKSDYIKLGIAVSNFNKKINLLQNDNITYLPQLRNYSLLKKEITTRQELNRQLSSLKKFTSEGQEKLYITKAGEQITKWEYNQLKKESNRIQKRLLNELKELETPLDSGFSKAQMGSLRVNEIKANIKSLQNIETKSDYEFTRLKNRIHYQGVQDYEMKMAYVYRDNYIYAIQNELSNYKNYSIFKEKIDKIVNPIDFFNYIQQSEILSDLFLWYDSESGTLQYGGFASNEDAFNYGLLELGLIDDVE